MKYCKCGYHFVAITTGGILRFICENCQNEVISSIPEDTLRSELILNQESNQKYQVAAKLAPHDIAGLKIGLECQQCGLPFMTLIYIGIKHTATYICSCGYQIEHAKLPEDVISKIRKVD